MYKNMICRTMNNIIVHVILNKYICIDLKSDHLQKSCYMPVWMVHMFLISIVRLHG